MANYDIIGDIAIIKFEKEVTKTEKTEFAKKFLWEHKNVKTVLEKADKVSGRLRTIKTNFLYGERKLETIHKENDCRFKLNIETCYFSPRLSNERIELAKIVSKKKNAKVLVLFAGVGPFSVVIAKFAKPKKIISIELGKECCKFAKKNIEMNKVQNIIEVIQGDVKKIIPKLKNKLIEEKFDFIIMPRPNLKDSFLKEAFSVCKKNTQIIYYGFCSEKQLEKMLSDINKEAKEYKKKINITKVKEAGDIAPYEHRYRIEIRAK